MYYRILTDGKIVTTLLAFIFDGKRTLQWNLLERQKENNFSGSDFKFYCLKWCEKYSLKSIIKTRI